MKIYCIDDSCQKRDKGYALCTGLMDISECPKVKAKEAAKKEGVNEKDSQSDCNVQM